MVNEVVLPDVTDNTPQPRLTIDFLLVDIPDHFIWRPGEVVLVECRNRVAICEWGLCRWNAFVGEDVALPEEIGLRLLISIARPFEVDLHYRQDRRQERYER